MPVPTVFISSTAYDLGMVRDSLQSMIRGLGYTPLLSEHSDVLFDPRIHTHTSCVKTIDTADLVVLIIGGRYGGAGVAEAIAEIDAKSLEDLKSQGGRPSITQLEILRALERGKPLFTFVRSSVLMEHRLYEANKSKDVQIEFPSIEKQETASFIFEFINFIRRRSTNNALFTFEAASDIETQLKRQWAMYFHRLLDEDQARDGQARQFADIGERLEDLKSAVVSAVTSESREVVAGVIKFRRLIEVLAAIPGFEISRVSDYPEAFNDMLASLGFRAAISAGREMGKAGGPTTMLLRDDLTGINLYMSWTLLEQETGEWAEFRKLDSTLRSVLFEEISSQGGVWGARPVTRKQLDEFRYRSELHQVFAMALGGDVAKAFKLIDGVTGFNASGGESS